MQLVNGMYRNILGREVVMEKPYDMSDIRWGVYRNHVVETIMNIYNHWKVAEGRNMRLINSYMREDLI